MLSGINRSKGLDVARPPVTETAGQVAKADKSLFGETAGSVASAASAPSSGCVNIIA